MTLANNLLKALRWKNGFGAFLIIWIPIQITMVSLSAIQSNKNDHTILILDLILVSSFIIILSKHVKHLNKTQKESTKQ